MWGINDEGHNRLVNYLFILVKRYIYVVRCTEKDISKKGLFNFVKKYFILDACSKASTYNRAKWDQVKPFFS